MVGFFYKLRRMKKRWWVLIGIGLVILIMILANLLNPNRNAKMVMVEEAKRGDIIETVSGPGTVKAKSEVSISTYVLSRVIDIAVEEGQEVKKGELLVQLDGTQYREEVVRASAGVRSAEAALEIAERQLVEGRETFDRQRSLYEDGLISKAEYDRSLTTYSSLETAYRQALSNLEQARALLVAAQDNLSKTRYTSPIDGVVTRINVEEGEVVVPGTMNIAGTEMMVISNMGVMEVEAEIDETDVVKTELGQEAQIELDAFPDRLFSGTVIEISKMPILTEGLESTQMGSTDYKVTVTLNDATPDILPGMSATVDIITATSEDVVYVPIQAIVKRAEDGRIIEGKMQKRVKYVGGVFLIEDNEAVFRQITTGISDDQYIEVKDGLKEGERIISGPYKLLRKMEAGDKVIEMKEEQFERP